MNEWKKWEYFWWFVRIYLEFYRHSKLHTIMCINVIKHLIGIQFYILFWSEMTSCTHFPVNSNWTNFQIHLNCMLYSLVFLLLLLRLHWHSIRTRMEIERRKPLNQGKLVFTRDSLIKIKSIGYIHTECRNRHCLFYMFFGKNNPNFVSSIC